MCDSSNYEYYKKHHICVRCGQEDAERNSTLCFRCRIKNRESSINYYRCHKEEQREKNRIKSKNRYNKLKELGLCTSCGKRQAKNNKVFCEHCAAKSRERNRKKYLLYVYATRNIAEIRV
jgi:NMD protein affecting ribosome stability and mRNA decay